MAVLQLCLGCRRQLRYNKAQRSYWASWDYQMSARQPLGAPLALSLSSKWSNDQACLEAPRRLLSEPFQFLQWTTKSIKTISGEHGKTAVPRLELQMDHCILHTMTIAALKLPSALQAQDLQARLDSAAHLVQ